MLRLFVSYRIVPSRSDLVRHRSWFGTAPAFLKLDLCRTLRKRKPQNIQNYLWRGSTQLSHTHKIRPHDGTTFSSMCIMHIIFIAHVVCTTCNRLFVEETTKMCGSLSASLIVEAVTPMMLDKMCADGVLISLWCCQNV